MVHVGDVAGGSGALADLVDRYGEGLRADFVRFYGRDLIDYLMGRRSPGEALVLINALPPSSVTKAMMRADPMVGGDPDRKPPAWVGFYEDDPATANAIRDLWDLQAAQNTPKGKKPPKVPRPKPDRPKGASRPRY